MLDIKWKNSKYKSIIVCFGITVLLTIILISFLPVFERRAENEFENPLTGDSFIEMLYESNFVQYKYLRDKADQKAWSYEDLYVDAEYIGTYEGEIHIYENETIRSVSVDVTEDSQSLQQVLNSYKTESINEIDEMKIKAYQLTQLADYYAVDKNTGISIGNSNEAALREILDEKEPTENPYVYYVYMSYDGAGNLSNCGVLIYGKVGEFLKKVEAGGRNSYFHNSYDENGLGYVYFYNVDREEYYRYKMTAKRPADMKIIYAMTQEQYNSFFNQSEDFNYGLYDYLPNYTYISEQSYLNAGVLRILNGFVFLAMLAGSLVAFLWKKENTASPNYIRLLIGKLPLELNLFLAILCFGVTGKMTDLICAYQKGWFFPDLTQNILQPLHMEWINFLLLCALFFFLFLCCYLLGSYAPMLVHPGKCFKENSILYRYWDRIINGIRKYCKSFYQELINYDVGTDANRMITKLVILNGLILCVISMFWVFGILFLIVYSLVIYLLLKKYVKDIQRKYRNLLRATSSIAGGDFDNALSEDFGVFESYKNELRQIQKDFKHAVEEEVKSQRMRSELITNVSHDLKTPLTAIITYINLLKEPDITDDQRTEYIQTLEKKAVRLKVLIDDLFEVSKASTNNITINYASVDIGSLIRQCYLEYEDRFLENDLQFKFSMPEEKIILRLDPQKTFRIFENLYTNIIKYALPSTRVYVVMKELEDEVEIEVKNISKTELQVSADELTERFVRGDGSRNTEGSGLGLAIARSFTELQRGSMQLTVDGDLFKVKLIFRKWNVDSDFDSDKKSKSLSEADVSDAKSCQKDMASGKGTAAIDPRRWRSEKNIRKKS